MYGQAAANITDDMDLVVYTAAVHADNPEYAEVVRRGIPMMTRAELLGQIMKTTVRPSPFPEPMERLRLPPW